jgi:hypothetical protein
MPSFPFFSSAPCADSSENYVKVPLTIDSTEFEAPPDKF